LRAVVICGKLRAGKQIGAHFMFRQFCAAFAVVALAVPGIAVADDAADDPDAVTITEEDGNGFFGHTCKFQRNRVIVILSNDTYKKYHCDVFCRYKMTSGAPKEVKCSATIEPNSEIFMCNRGARNFDGDASTSRDCNEIKG